MVRGGDIVLLVILFAVLGVSGWAYWQITQGKDLGVLDQVRGVALPDPEDLGKFGVEDTDFGEGRGLQFYGRMRYRSNVIPYWIEDSCSLDKQRDILDAFKAVESETVLEFVADREMAEIRVLCAELEEEKGKQKHILAGEGGPSEIINTSRYGVIFAGEIALYRDEKGDTPQVAIHELLHALGFDHNDDKDSIMYPITSCGQTIDATILSEMSRLYAEETLPDLVMDEVEVVKQGGYLHFNVTVSNQGLADVGEAKLVVEADGNFVQEFLLGEVEIGASRILSAQFIKVKRDVEELRFSVRGDEGAGQELDGENNVVEIMIGGG